MKYFATRYLVLSMIIQLFSFRSIAQTFDETIKKYVTLLKLPAVAFAVAREDSLIYFKSFGTNHSEKIGPDHIIGIASLTKTMSAVALQKAIGQGKCSWDDKIAKFPNQYFNENRWNSETSIGHLFSMTAEGNPIGKNFVYNGSKYNLVFNVFQTLNQVDNKADITARFTYEIDHTIFKPLGMNHTINRYDSLQIIQIGDKVVVPYNFDDSSGQYSLQDFNVKFINSGPAFGMMSSVNDLVKYSTALDQNTILTKAQYEQITRPYFPGSPYGLGWFTCQIAGYDVHWAYGYGFNDAAILLKIPEKKLTFILLSASTMPSASTRLAYGDPLNSVMVVSFIKNFVLDIDTTDMIDYNHGSSKLAYTIKALDKKYHTDIFTDELYAEASLGLLLPKGLNPNRVNSERMLKLYLQIKGKKVSIKSPLIFELLAKCDDNSFDKHKKQLINRYNKTGFFHPSTAYFIGNIFEQSGKISYAVKYYQSVADDDYYNENADKFSAMMWLAKHFKNNNQELSKSYLRRLIKFKENISAFDDQYKEAKSLLDENY